MIHVNYKRAEQYRVRLRLIKMASAIEHKEWMKMHFPTEIREGRKLKTIQSLIFYGS